jgi:hypothetical protein
LPCPRAAGGGSKKLKQKSKAKLARPFLSNKVKISTMRFSIKILAVTIISLFWYPHHLRRKFVSGINLIHAA